MRDIERDARRSRGEPELLSPPLVVDA
jgi:hypothetical protein